MRQLLEAGADANARDFYGNFSLLAAAGWSPRPVNTVCALLYAPGMTASAAWWCVFTG